MKNKQMKSRLAFSVKREKLLLLISVRLLQESVDVQVTTTALLIFAITRGTDFAA